MKTVKVGYFNILFAISLIIGQGLYVPTATVFKVKEAYKERVERFEKSGCLYPSGENSFSFSQKNDPADSMVIGTIAAHVAAITGITELIVDGSITKVPQLTLTTLCCTTVLVRAITQRTTSYNEWRLLQLNDVGF